MENKCEKIALGRDDVHSSVEIIICNRLKRNFVSAFVGLDDWENEWVYSEHPGKEFGKFKRTAGKFYNDEEADKGMQFERKSFSMN